MRARQLALLYGAVFYLAVVLLASGNELFWDSILLSGQYGWHFYTHFLETWFVPNEMAGYPPLWGYFLAMVWKVTGGPSLWWSHAAMWPILMLLVYNALQLIEVWQLHSRIELLLMGLLLEPVLLAQATQVAPDLALVAFMLGGMAGVYGNKPVWAMCYTTLLIWLSPRGGFHALALVLMAVWQAFHHRAYARLAWRVTAVFVIAAICWYVPHYLHFGWIGYQKSSQWSAFTQSVDVSGFFRNVAVLLLRLMDMNKWVIWLIMGVLILKYRKEEAVKSIAKSPMLFSFICILLVQIPVWLIYQNPIGHRYLIVPFILINWFVIELVSKHLIWHWWYYALLMGIFISAHFITLPGVRARGWDATLAHWPYFKLKQRALKVIQEQQIMGRAVCTWFPADGAEQFKILKSSDIYFDSCEPSSHRYMLWSNVFNVKAPDERNYRVLWAAHSGQVHMMLCEKLSE